MNASKFEEGELRSRLNTPWRANEGDIRGADGTDLGVMWDPKHASLVAIAVETVVSLLTENPQPLEAAGPLKSAAEPDGPTDADVLEALGFDGWTDRDIRTWLTAHDARVAQQALRDRDAAEAEKYRVEGAKWAHEAIADTFAAKYPGIAKAIRDLGESVPSSDERPDEVEAAICAAASALSRSELSEDDEGCQGVGIAGHGHRMKAHVEGWFDLGAVVGAALAAARAVREGSPDAH